MLRRRRAPRRAPAANVFITGASSGLGSALAHLYGQRGARVGCMARHAEGLAPVARALGERCVAYVGDVRDAESVAAAARDYLQRFGVPDVVIANAGVSRGTLTERAEDEPVFRAIIETNVLGLVHTFAPFIPAMRADRRGTLAGIASVAGFRGLPGSSAYCASKAAAIAYLESLRLELSTDGLLVVTVCPGYLATRMTERNPYRMPFLLDADDAARRIARVIEAGRAFAVVPWPMAIAGRALRCAPRWLYDRAFARAPRKPRDVPI